MVFKLLSELSVRVSVAAPVKSTRLVLAVPFVSNTRPDKPNEVLAPLISNFDPPSSVMVFAAPSG